MTYLETLRKNIKIVSAIAALSSLIYVGNFTSVNNKIEENDLTFQTIAKFELFIPKAYWDVNAYRVGYGSDTITKSNGKIYKVLKTSIVNKEEATLDLKRRIKEFQATVIKQIGRNIWNSFGESTKAALTSVAYNYGSLPKNIVAACKTRNLKLIANSIKDRAVDNKGINKHRRLKEANMIK
jgi:GH24 family phage-related lysozyme (muramidase)